MAETVKQARALREASKLLRRAKLRKMLSTRSGIDGYSTKQEMADELGVSLLTLHKDLEEVGAVKLAAEHEGRTIEWWAIPAYNPSLPNWRQHMPLEMIENDVALKVAAHVTEILVAGQDVIVKCERAAGPLLADRLSLLTWPEILHVIEQRDAAIVRCVDVEAASVVHSLLMGGE